MHKKKDIKKQIRNAAEYLQELKFTKENKDYILKNWELPLPDSEMDDDRFVFDRNFIRELMVKKTFILPTKVSITDLEQNKE